VDKRSFLVKFCFFEHHHIFSIFKQSFSKSLTIYHIFHAKIFFNHLYIPDGTYLFSLHFFMKKLFRRFILLKFLWCTFGYAFSFRFRNSSM